ncbi:hypothetical protein LR48_Vigan03g179800 [Vigna angularis]|uniref:Uncharacterized protein n=1 Tax=Phaseolus angularis TaxID=3914 RepID=A0A0L9U6L8_PHAAN|nr:hypothetical protein LR48_Vigan03g179800 [Vigna angularis]
MLEVEKEARYHDFKENDGVTVFIQQSWQHLIQAWLQAESTYSSLVACQQPPHLYKHIQDEEALTAAAYSNKEEVSAWRKWAAWEKKTSRGLDSGEKGWKFQQGAGQLAGQLAGQYKKGRSRQYQVLRFSTIGSNFICCNIFQFDLIF